MAIGYTGIGLTNPKSATNVGAIMRAAGCFGVNEVFYSGKRYEYAARHQTDTKNVQQHIPLRPTNDFISELPEGTKVVCVELVEGAIPLPSFTHPEKAFYIFGPEDGNLNQAIVDQADAVVYVPTSGCLNLAASVNILLYDKQAKSTDSFCNGALVRASRDKNNNLQVKPA